MKLIAKKPCSFGGKKFYIGDEIPAGLVLNPNGQEKMGVLVQVNDAQEHPAPDNEAKTAATITVNIHAKEGDLPLELTPAGIQSVFDVLTAKVDEAETIIEKMTEDDALILLHLTDPRKSIKNAAETRAKAINAEQEAAESAGEQ